MNKGKKTVIKPFLVKQHFEIYLLIKTWFNIDSTKNGFECEIKCNGKFSQVKPHQAF